MMFLLLALAPLIACMVPVALNVSSAGPGLSFSPPSLWICPQMDEEINMNWNLEP